MRPSRSKAGPSYRIGVLLALLATPVAARAQKGSLPGGVSSEGAPELVLPTGARSMALGQAAIADPGGTESVWWNPALLAWSTKRELAMHFTKSFAVSDNAAAFLLPVPPIGSVTLSARLFDYGTQDVTLADSSVAGSFSARAYVWGASFAAPFGDRLSAGISYKLYQFIIACSVGDCSQVPLASASTSAVDAGVDWRLPGVPVALAAAVQNLGPALQVRDSPQRDRLPARLTIGGCYTPTIPSLGPDVALRVDAAVITRLREVGLPGARLGGELTWQKRLQARAGYVLYSPTGSGPSAGLGITTGRLQLDIARFFSDQSSSSGQTPTFISLRFLF